MGWPAFDAICLWDVIEHLRDPVAVCRSLVRMLKPGGYLFLSTPDTGALIARLMGSDWAFMIPPLHLGYFSRSSLNHLFRACVPMQIRSYSTRGKWTSIAFLFYKLNQISARMAPRFVLRWLSGSPLGHMNLSIPTNDIAYVAVQRPILGE